MGSSNQQTGVKMADKEEYRYPGSELLPINTNQQVPRRPVPGTEILYYYWKIRLHLEIANRYIELYVPPEWRSIRHDRLEEWTDAIRDNPYEDIILGGVTYHRLPHLILPCGQLFKNLPIPGLNGLPEFKENVPCFEKPRVKYSDGEFLPIKINRTPPSYLMNGVEKYYCYWKISLPVESRYCVWVPPEWRFLTPEARERWSIILAGNINEEVTLGGTRYKWNGNDIMPIGQHVELLETIGFGDFSFLSQDESDDENSIDEFPSNNVNEKENDDSTDKEDQYRKEFPAETSEPSHTTCLHTVTKGIRDYDISGIQRLDPSEIIKKGSLSSSKEANVFATDDIELIINDFSNTIDETEPIPWTWSQRKTTCPHETKDSVSQTDYLETEV